MRAVYNKARPKGQDGRNQTEALFEKELLLRQAAGEILGYWFEPFSLNLQGAMYRPDFLVHTKDQELRIYEVKALTNQCKPLITDAARSKLSMLRARFPFRVLIAAYHKDIGWHYFEVN